MSRINALVADSDELYIDGLCKYLMEKYSDRLNIIAFTNKLLLQDYIINNFEKIDIQLISFEMICDGITEDNPRLLYLSETKNCNKSEEITAIFKYQSADSIALQIFDEFSHYSLKEVDIKSGNHNSRVIAVYSPAGGSGKSTVAAALCKCLIKKTYNAFYLNLETAPTTQSFFNSDSNYNLSDILYGIKERNKNLALKIESGISIDSVSGVAFFAPGESPLEMEEMLPEDIVLLINQLRLLGKFDYIVVDMSSAQNTNNIEILKESDIIITVVGTGSIAKCKLKTIKKLYEIVNQREKVNLYEKNIVLFNKNNSTEYKAYIPEGIAETVLSLPDLGQAEPEIVSDELAAAMGELVTKL